MRYSISVVFYNFWFYLDKPETAKKAALEHLRLTHLGKKMEQAGLLFAEVLLKLFKGISLREALVTEIERQEIPLAAHPFLKWLTEPDGYVVGQRFSTAWVPSGLSVRAPASPCGCSMRSTT